MEGRLKLSLIFEQAVEVQRAPDAEWEPATYEMPVTGWKGWHRVRLPKGKERYIDTLSGEEIDRDHDVKGKGALTPFLYVPSRRLRARKD
jgi:hypothetical protein